MAVYDDQNLQFKFKHTANIMIWQRYHQKNKNIYTEEYTNDLMIDRQQHEESNAKGTRGAECLLALLYDGHSEQSRDDSYWR